MKSLLAYIAITLAILSTGLSVYVFSQGDETATVPQAETADLQPLHEKIETLEKNLESTKKTIKENQYGLNPPRVWTDEHCRGMKAWTLQEMYNEKRTQDALTQIDQKIREQSAEKIYAEKLDAPWNIGQYSNNLHIITACQDGDLRYLHISDPDSRGADNWIASFTLGYSYHTREGIFPVEEKVGSLHVSEKTATSYLDQFSILEKRDDAIYAISEPPSTPVCPGYEMTVPCSLLPESLQKPISIEKNEYRFEIEAELSASGDITWTAEACLGLDLVSKDDMISNDTFERAMEMIDSQIRAEEFYEREPLAYPWLQIEPTVYNLSFVAVCRDANRYYSLITAFDGMGSYFFVASFTDETDVIVSSPVSEGFRRTLIQLEKRDNQLFANGESHSEPLCAIGDGVDKCASIPEHMKDKSTPISPTKYTVRLSENDITLEK
ncbi:MAG: hypothetical protein HOE53_03365 [Candidatus Magasanikbacteria bacterium]|jgi:hypothetical protein|nr:hypothetical protein [Candidatus Magasanikbacteria bacterium]